jgi:DNA-directed RNA polymerase subunit RPC12/RpoP
LGAVVIETRDPEPQTRDPQTRKPRRYIPASMPVVCPDCGHSTRMENGRHVDPVRRRVLEYRTCAHCGSKLAAGRDMTAKEAEILCTHADSVADYESSL